MSVIFPIEHSSRLAGPFTATAGQTLFAGNFPLQADTDLTVTRQRGVLALAALTLDTDYTVSGLGDPAGFTVTLTAGAEAGDEITLTGRAVIERLTSVTQGGAASGARIDTEFDRNRMIDQELRTAVDTALAGVDAEAATRASADGVLQTNINSEATARASADGTLQTNINGEAVARAAADGVLQTNINALAALEALDRGDINGRTLPPSALTILGYDNAGRPLLVPMQQLSTGPAYFNGEGTLAGRAAFDASAPPFKYLVNDVDPMVFYQRGGAAGTWLGPFQWSVTNGQILNAAGRFVTRDAPSAALAAARADGQIIEMAGLTYRVDSTAIGAASATNDLGVNGLVPAGLVVRDAHYGAAGVTDDTAKLQAMMDFAGANSVPFEITRVCLCANPLYIKSHSLKGGFTGAGKITYTGAGAAIRSQRVAGVYPVSCELAFSVELTADSQVGWDYELSYSTARLLLKMNAAACTNCVGMNLIGDVTSGTGSYYNSIRIRGQAAHQSNTHLLRTVNNTADYASNRGPNANVIYVERVGQFDVAIYDRIGGGNVFIVQSCEAAPASAATSYCIYAGNDTSAARLTGNVYQVQYTENVGHTFQSITGRFGSACYLSHTYATGGQAVDDPIGMLREKRGIPGFYHKTAAAQPFVIEMGAAALYPSVRGPSPFWRLIDTALSDTELIIGTSGATAVSTHAFRVLHGGVELFRAGTAGIYPVTNETKELGKVTERWLRVFGKEFRPGAGTVIWTSGAGSPEGVVVGSPGSIYGRTDGGPGSTLWVKESGTGNTGWVAK